MLCIFKVDRQLTLFSHLTYIQASVSRLNILAKWVLVVNDSTGVLAGWLESKMWPIFERTKNKKDLAVGDEFVVYKAGGGGQRFVARGKISNIISKPDGALTLNITDLLYKKEGVPVADLLMKLDFVTNKVHWTNYFNGGARPISDQSYKLISESLESV